MFSSVFSFFVYVLKGTKTACIEMGALCVTCKKKQVVIRRFSKRLSSIHVMTFEENRKIATERDLVIGELVDTERNYVRHLGMVVNGYMALMEDPNRKIPAPENWDEASETDLFGNLKSIYVWHKNVFLKELERCQSNPNELGPLFERNERKMLSLYTKYSHNKVKSEQMTEEFAEYLKKLTVELGHSQQLNELLFKPIQRITIYHLLMSRIYEGTRKIRKTEAEPIHRALKVVKNLPHNINEMMKFRELMGYTTNDDGNGKLLYHGRLLCTEGGGANDRVRKKSIYYKGEDFMVYLFEKNIFFNVVVGMNAKHDPKCYYRNHIPVNNMTFGEVLDSKYTFTIRTMRLEFAMREDPHTAKGERPKGDFVAYTCRAETAELYSEWIDALTKVLQQRYEFAVTLENPTTSRN